jgi:hypothetical protein
MAKRRAARTTKRFLARLPLTKKTLSDSPVVLRLPNHQAPHYLNQSPAHNPYPTAVDRGLFAATIVLMNPWT